MVWDMSDFRYDEYLRAIYDGDMPEFLLAYLETPEMQRLRDIGLLCGSDYTKLYDNRFYYSRYDHSLAAALLVWRFTKDMRPTLATLFHDISSPIFSHCVDYMNGDALTQESTEAPTGEILRRSPEIMTRLRRDGIDVSAVEDYHIYPIADNEHPRLSADRLENTISTAMAQHGCWTIAQVADMLNDLTIREDEFCFRTPETASFYAQGTAAVYAEFQTDKNKLFMQLLGDILKMSLNEGLFTMDELYRLTEQEAMARIEEQGSARLKAVWRAFQGLDRVYASVYKMAGKYCVSIDAKRRYIDPLCLVDGVPMRVSTVCPEAKAAIEELLAMRSAAFAYVDFDI